MSTTTATPSASTTTYTPYLDALETERAIAWLKPYFADALAQRLDLQKVCAPVVVQPETGLNDDLNGVEQPVRFALGAASSMHAEVVQSLAKWKRWRLHTLGIGAGQGLYTDMRALRPDDTISPLHSIYVDQWDWEKHITREQRTVPFLKETVRAVYAAIRDTQAVLIERHPELGPMLPETLTFVHAEELRQRYPDLEPKAREQAFGREHAAYFVIGVGGAPGDGEIHDGRAPDYDDWTTESEDGLPGLNGDLMLWHPGLEQAVEISSMGIRVDAEALERQLAIRDCTERLAFPFHQALLDEELPLSVGGGIGQARLCLLLLRKAHVGEVQVGVWPEAVHEECQAAGIPLLA